MCVGEGAHNESWAPHVQIPARTGQHVHVSKVEVNEKGKTRAKIEFDKDGSPYQGFVTAVRDKEVLLREDHDTEYHLKRYENAHWKPDTLTAATALTQRSFFERMQQYESQRAGREGSKPSPVAGSKHPLGMPQMGFLTADPND